MALRGPGGGPSLWDLPRGWRPRAGHIWTRDGGRRTCIWLRMVWGWGQRGPAGPGTSGSLRREKGGDAQLSPGFSSGWWWNPQRQGRGLGRGSRTHPQAQTRLRLRAPGWGGAGLGEGEGGVAGRLELRAPAAAAAADGGGGAEEGGEGRSRAGPTPTPHTHGARALGALDAWPGPGAQAPGRPRCGGRRRWARGTRGGRFPSGESGTEGARGTPGSLLSFSRAPFSPAEAGAPSPGGTTGSLSAIQKMTRVRVVDNSALGNTPYHRPPRCIHVYNKSGVGKVGDQILLAIKGQKKKALIVGHRMPGPQMSPRFDSNNVVLIEDNGNPVGTRIKTPIPTSLRKREGEYSKVLAIAQNFV
uniref:Large ribosomal subunit protein uL14m n=1 Tax=Oryctolagus cuniculus TaxID=9986 RepID=A0A5F9DPR0_RABIT